jgi:hypothetical protein
MKSDPSKGCLTCPAFRQDKAADDYCSNSHSPQFTKDVAPGECCEFWERKTFGKA